MSHDDCPPCSCDESMLDVARNRLECPRHNLVKTARKFAACQNHCELRKTLDAGIGQKQRKKDQKESGKPRKRTGKGCCGGARTAIIGWMLAMPQLKKQIDKWRKPEDVGVGDTLRNIAEASGAEAVAEFMKAHGLDCGCEDERQYWNQKMPYKNVRAL